VQRSQSPASSRPSRAQSLSRPSSAGSSRGTASASLSASVSLSVSKAASLSALPVYVNTTSSVRSSCTACSPERSTIEKQPKKKIVNQMRKRKQQQQKHGQNQQEMFIYNRSTRAADRDQQRPKKRSQSADRAFARTDIAASNPGFGTGFARSRTPTGTTRSLPSSATVVADRTRGGSAESSRRRRSSMSGKTKGRKLKSKNRAEHDTEENEDRGAVFWGDASRGGERGRRLSADQKKSSHSGSANFASAPAPSTRESEFAVTSETERSDGKNPTGKASSKTNAMKSSRHKTSPSESSRDKILPSSRAAAKGSASPLHQAIAAFEGELMNRLNAAVSLSHRWFLFIKTNFTLKATNIFMY